MTFTPIAVYFLYFIFSRPDSQLCTPQDRTTDCSNAEFQPICALYTGKDCHSTTGYCYRTLTTTCDACLDETVLGYTLGECEETTVPQICKKDQRGSECPVSNEKGPFCGYMKPQKRFRGKFANVEEFDSSCEACSSEQIMFNVPGECQPAHSLGVCRDHKHKKCDNEQAEPLCAYYTGEDCQEKLCRRTMMNSCNVCKEPNVLFYVKGECQGEVPSDSDERVEEMLRDDGSDNQDEPITELEAVVQVDGDVVYEEVNPEPQAETESDCYVESQIDIPELETIVVREGDRAYEIIVPQREVASEPEIPQPVMEFVATVIYEKMETLIEEVKEAVANIPELAAALQEDGTTVYEDLKALEKSDELADVDCVMEYQENIPELEAVVQEDGSVVYEEVKAPQVEDEIEDAVDCVMEYQENIPELEAVVQADGSVVYEEVKAPQVEEEIVDCFVEYQENIPELEAVVQADGSVVYEEVQAPKEVNNEEAAVIDSNGEEVVDCFMEYQENIPELEAVVQADGSVVYEEVQVPKEINNEEATIIDFNGESIVAAEEEKIELTISNASPQVIDSRLLANDPKN